MNTKMTAKQIIAAAYEMSTAADVVAEAAANVAKCPLARYDIDPASYIDKAARSVVRRCFAEQQEPIRAFAAMIAAHRVKAAQVNNGNEWKAEAKARADAEAAEFSRLVAEFAGFIRSNIKAGRAVKCGLPECPEFHAALQEVQGEAAA